MSPSLILLVDDNQDIATFLSLELQSEGYRVELAFDGYAGLTKFRQLNPDLLILDWEMPNMNGVDICRQVRRSSNVPILLLTAKTTIQNKVEGLDAGANDYLGKPFELDELLARVRSLLRRNTPAAHQELFFADIRMDIPTHEVYRNQLSIELSSKEFDLLKYLLQHPRQILSKSQIFEAVWGWDSEQSDNSVEVYIHSLRNKLEQNGQSRVIHTKRGVGYLLKE